MAKPNILMREKHAFGRALLPTAVNTTKINGDAIVTPWRTARRLCFVAVAGTMLSNDSITFTVERRRIGTSTWDSCYEPNGSTALASTAQTGSGTAGTKAGGLATGAWFGELDLNDLKCSIIGGDTYDYDAIRLCAVNGVAQNVTVSATYVLADLMIDADRTTADTEDLWNKQRYTAGNADVAP